MNIRIVERIDDLDSAAWNACAGGQNPFVSHSFLLALEQSGSVGHGSGWLPRHLALADEAGGLLATTPLYVKTHSQGEYVFDHGWADAWERAGGRYYPKLQAAVPFTPVPGPRLLAPDVANAKALKLAMAEAIKQVCDNSELSSAHVTFADKGDIDRLREAGYLVRTSLQYHWFNDNYEDFDHFLSALSARKRKAIKKEREAVAASGLQIRCCYGSQLTTDQWDSFFAFYMDTGGRKWGRPYLTRRFFTEIAQRMPEKILLILAEHSGKPIAGALNFIGSDALFGRYWGCTEEHRFLHFELCYYQAIEFAIRHRLRRVEAGAQGEHKIQRGYVPTETLSAHWISHQGFRDAISDFLERETVAVAREKSALMKFSPFRRPLD